MKKYDHFLISTAESVRRILVFDVQINLYTLKININLFNSDFKCKLHFNLPFQKYCLKKKKKELFEK